MPFCYKGNWTFYEKGDKFFLIEEKGMYFDDGCGIGLKVGWTENLPFDGYCRADSFKEYEVRS
jgi:hypothetical protein